MEERKMFSKGKIGAVELKNRVIMAAMSSNLGEPDGTPGDRTIRYYEERAKGGLGLIITEYIRVNEVHGNTVPLQLSIVGDDKIPAFEDLAKSVHKYGTKIFGQLQHPGALANPTHQHQGELVAPSGCESIYGKARALTTEECESLVNDFASGAAKLKIAGFDGVEIHAAHGYLLSRFLSPFANQRTDKYGGSLENRVRIIIEIIRKIKNTCGPLFPISVRINGDDYIENGVTLEMSKQIASLLEQAGADAINVSNGVPGADKVTIEPISYEEGWKAHLGESIKETVNIPVLAVNNIKSPEMAEGLLNNKVCDFVVLGRALLADPEFVKKTYENRRKEIIPCMSCLNCTESEYRGGRVSCAANPLTGVERDYLPLVKNGEKKKVVIVGAGPAGLEAARTLAKRNFEPIIFEKCPVIGGSVYLGSLPPLKEKLSTYLDFYKNELERLSIELRLNQTVEIEDLISLDPYAVINATGALPLRPQILGVDQTHVYTVTDILSGEKTLENQHIAIVGSGMTGLETAEYLIEKGNKVTVVEMQDRIGPDAFPLNLYDVLKRLTKSNVELLPNKKLKAIGENNILIEDLLNLSEEEIAVDGVVLSLGIKSNRKLLDQLGQLDCPVINIGDSEKPGRIVDAVRAGYNAAYTMV